MNARYYQVVTTLPDRAAADRMARFLVKSRLAACCQVLGPSHSTYWWQEKLESANEWMCLAKTDRTRLKRLIAAVEKNHPYDTPEVIALPIHSGSERYLEWIRSVLGA